MWDFLRFTPKELYECEACSAKPGSPQLCPTCLSNRAKAGDAWLGPRPAREVNYLAHMTTERDAALAEVEHWRGEAQQAHALIGAWAFEKGRTT